VRAFHDGFIEPGRWENPILFGFRTRIILLAGSGYEQVMRDPRK
jgi:hypothetical protein